MIPRSDAGDGHQHKRLEADERQCRICGYPVGAPSLGGPLVCAWCDCDGTGVGRLKAENAALRASLKTAQEKEAELAAEMDDVRAVTGAADSFAQGIGETTIQAVERIVAQLKTAEDDTGAWHEQADRDLAKWNQLAEAVAGAGDRTQSVLLRRIQELKTAEQEREKLSTAVERTLNCDCLLCTGCSEELEAASGLKATDEYDWRPMPRTPVVFTYSKEIQERIDSLESQLSTLLAAQERLIAEMKVWVQDGRETHPCDHYENFAGVCGHCDWSEISHDVWKWAKELSTLRGQA